MYAATFTFAKREFDDEFHALDRVIAEVAKSIPGYVGEESWENAASGLVCNVYYWHTLEAIQTLMSHPAHLAAKQRQAQWLQGYQVVIAQVLGCYGDQQLAHPLAGLKLDFRRGSPGPCDPPGAAALQSRLHPRRTSD